MGVLCARPTMLLSVRSRLQVKPTQPFPYGRGVRCANWWPGQPRRAGAKATMDITGRGQGESCCVSARRVIPTGRVTSVESSQGSASHPSNHRGDKTSHVASVQDVSLRHVVSRQSSRVKAGRVTHRIIDGTGQVVSRRVASHQVESQHRKPRGRNSRVGRR